MKKNKTLLTLTALTLALLLALCGCGSSTESSSKSGNAAGAATSLSLDTSDMFTSRDLETDYDESTATKLTLSDENPKIKITSAGTYIITGTATDGSITVEASDDDKVQIVLNGVTLTSKTSAAIYVKSADKVFITTAKGTENTISNGGTFTAIDDENIDGAIFAKDDIVFNGEGTLNVTSPAKHGIVGKDDVKFTSGEYVIECASHGVDANDSIRITEATIKITADKDGLHCENDDDTSKGYIYIASGTLNIESDDDGVHANTYLVINDGALKITAAEGLEATVVQINGGTVDIEASDDGINAAKKSDVSTPLVEINGGKITIVMGRGDTDGIDSNGDIIINGGTVDVTGNSTFDYNGKGVINGGTVIVNGEEVSELPNQFGGMGDMGGRPDGMRGGSGDGATDAITSPTPNADGERPEMPSFDKDGKRPELPENGSDGERPEMPDFGKNYGGTEKPQKPWENFDGESGKTESGKGT